MDQNKNTPQETYSQPDGIFPENRISLIPIPPVSHRRIMCLSAVSYLPTLQ